MGAFASGAARLGSFLRGVGPAVARAPRYVRPAMRAFSRSIPKGKMAKAKFFGLGALNLGANAWFLSDMAHEIFGSDELSSDQKKLLEDELMNALASDSVGQEMYQQQLMSGDLDRMRSFQQRAQMTPQDLQSNVRAAALTRMLQDHEENLMKNALTESQLQQSSAFAPNYSELSNALDRRYQ